MDVATLVYNALVEFTAYYYSTNLRAHCTGAATAKLHLGKTISANYSGRGNVRCEARGRQRRD